ncbi:hybrid sensor histidine kinase/response regulator [Pseudobacteriovorax antillogorgiicola]|uniref:histidine kinase n=1 Tax=Pseudobacteriovorax antillogorgiicola TaxID=1513793 RepID=A0A1Y6CSU5_9BACT|nr:HAMP domain-containing sensor histidine kinase [Pseudobacteriovorax antillogorgiicola]TCS44972.1 signal transduction histidine kinase [Pseudobacteriovorax antillogorgiicola]SMF76788.1 Signal transduction histidine kinase [Pseudobacteriovorax antillogorgiicola]
MGTYSIIVASNKSEDQQFFRSIADLDSWHFRFAQNFSELLQFAANKVPDVLVIDENLPDEGAEAIVSMIRSMPSLIDVALVVMTDERQGDFFRRLASAGADEFCRRPLETHILRVRLSSLGRRTRQLSLTTQQKEVAKNLFRIVAHDVSNLFINFEVFIRSVERGQDPEAQQKRLVRAKKTLSEVRELLRNVKTLDAMRSESLVLDLVPVSIQDCIEKVSDVYADRMTDKRVRLAVDWQVDPSTMVKADAPSLKHQVIGNILTNAIKFSYPDSEIKITVKDDPDYVMIGIRDHGVGIKSDLAKSLFDEQKSQSTIGTAGEKGTGYGMPLAYQFVKAYKGRLEVVSQTQDESPDDHGTEFRIYIPKHHLQAA